MNGTLSPAQRIDRIQSLGEATGEEGWKRVLVATDCLSEGVNLQHYFNAVVHYDLAWNPTRHEQREGRVDRFGQRSAEVRSQIDFEDKKYFSAVEPTIAALAGQARKVRIAKWEEKTQTRACATGLHAARSKPYSCSLAVQEFTRSAQRA